MDVVTYALCKKYVAKSLEGAGALKGQKGDPGEKGDPFKFEDFTSAQLESLKGEQGEKGDSFKYEDFTEDQLSALKGLDGLNAYELAKLAGFSGTEDEWLNSLQGEKGDPGAPGKPGEKGDPGKDYIITEADYNEIAKKVNVPSNTSDLTNDANFISDVKLNGESVVNENGVINLNLGNLDTTLGEEVVCTKDIGGISAGTTFTKETTLADIIKALLTIPVVETEGSIYYGTSKTIPTSTAGLTPIEVSRDTLLSSGYTYKNISTEEEYVLLAIPKSLGIECYAIKTSGFEIGYDVVITDKYLIYYDVTPSTLQGVRYQYSFEEV